MTLVEQQPILPVTSPVERLFKEYPVYEKLFREVTPFLTEGRPYNYIHTLWGMGDVYSLIKGESREDLLPVVAGAFPFHDAGWPRVPNVKTDPAVWSNLDGRVLHMRVGVELAAEKLPQYGYTPEVIGEVEELIAHHDDVYLAGKPLDTDVLKSHTVKLPETPAQKMHRDADALFVFSIYFWKDWWTRGRKNGTSPEDFLTSQVQKYGTMNTATGQRLVDEQIVQRKAEVAKGETRYEAFYNLTEQINEETTAMANKGDAPLAIASRVQTLIHAQVS